VTLAISKGGKDYIFLIASNILVITANSACCVHMDTELTDLNFIP
jgi:hypothetical protein